jgi:hypothetical protein
MRTDIRLTPKDVQVQKENALDLYYSGIKAAETKRTMTRNLKTFLVDACADLLQGNLEQRAQQFVDLTHNEQQKATQIILAYLTRLRERTFLEKTNPAYINPSTLPNKIKLIKKLLDMNGIGLGRKRIYTTIQSGRVY